jgi:hypothetical protein
MEQLRDRVRGQGMEFAAWAFLALGVLQRLVRYGLHFPLWGDEYLLTFNFLDRGYLDLLQPLDHHQVAPILFLWIELAATRVLGFSEWSLRLVPLVCGLAALFIYFRLVARNFDKRAALVALAIFAVSIYTVRYNAEVKPYSIDALAAVLLLWLALQWSRDGRLRWLWSLAIAAPCLVLASYPSLFVTGGVALALVPSLCRKRSWRHWLAFLALCGLMAVSVALVAKLSAARQFSAERAVMQHYWDDAFPPTAQPGKLAGWLLATHTGEMFAYPVGSERGGGTLQFVMFAVGLACLLRGPRHELACAILAMLGLALAAAALRLYPYGGHPRLMQYAAPAICLCMGVGISRVLGSMRHPRLRRASLGFVLLLCGLIGAGGIIRDVVHPYRDKHERIYRDMARWFWGEENRRQAEVICLRTDLDLDFYPTAKKFQKEIYRCNQRIYSRRHRRGPQRPNFQRVTAQRPLRCVVYHQLGAKRDDARFRDWLAGMRQRFELAGVTTYRWRETAPNAFEVYEVYEFVPKTEHARRGAAPTRQL